MRILITGANGFLGGALQQVLNEHKYEVLGVARQPYQFRHHIISTIDRNTDWDEILNQGFDVVIHLAAQVPVADDESKEGHQAYQETNVLGTAQLVRACIAHKVKRFVFMSSAKVMGDGQPLPYQESDPAKPGDAYAISKWEAEQAVIELANQSVMEYAILRPPLIYGPGVKGNFFRLMQAISQGRPLPLGGIDNRRSFLYLGNLIDAMIRVIDDPKAANQIYFVSDGEDVSTTQLIELIGAALHQRPKLFSLPLGLIKRVATVFGKESAIERLTNSFALNTAAIQKDLGWSPPYTMTEGLAITAQWYQDQCSHYQTAPQSGIVYRGGESFLNRFLFRSCDLVFSALGLILLAPLMLGIYLVGWAQTRSPLFMQTRMGCEQIPFILIKFRTMRIDTPSTATHLVDPQQITALGAFLRKTKLDELPQLWNVLKGEMSLVGPRPCLPTQTELIAERAALGVFTARPGITGLAQIQGIDMSNPKQLAQVDAQMLATLNLPNYFRYLLKTVLGSGFGDRVRKSP